MAAQYLDIIILLVVVIVIYNRLKNVIGTHPDQVESTKISEENAAKIFDIIVKEAQKQQSIENAEKTTGEELKQIQPAELSETDLVLNKIPGFDKETFIMGAKRAFEIIVAAFANQDSKTLEMLISHNLFKKFQDVIEKRQAEGITSETDFIGFDSAEIIHAEITKDDTAQITVKFVSQQVNMLKNAEGTVIEGDECYIQNITDVWTFEKALSSTNPNWILISTKK